MPYDYKTIALVKVNGVCRKLHEKDQSADR